ncbi:unnamed protein product [Linum tenue]|uniref:Uncharacterized protein n=1 Tax=Linum tenue TaxID=586396 RepID=A0AAV0J5S1_9ROSI|nr:unnamed protein product [Linum tenue]
MSCSSLFVCFTVDQILFYNCFHHILFLTSCNIYVDTTTFLTSLAELG